MTEPMSTATFRLLSPMLEASLIAPIDSALTAALPELSAAERTTLAVNMARSGAWHIRDLVWDRYFAPSGH